jgi:hypothetical protein
MTDIFFSYSSKDRERVRLVHQTLTGMGFDIFWDQELPAGIKWDAWIRQHLGQAKCAIVFWSQTSATSDNVHHEATIAKQHGKLIPVLLDALTAEQFPMGLYSVQGVNLSAWIGDLADAEWLKLQREIEAKLTPMWVRRLTDSLEAELVAERSRREAAERRDKTLRDQIAKEAQTQQELRRERDEALEELTALRSQLADLQRHVASPNAPDAALMQRVKELQAERDRFAAQAVDAARKSEALEQYVAGLNRAEASPGMRLERPAPTGPDGAPPSRIAIGEPPTASLPSWLAAQATGQEPAGPNGRSSVADAPPDGGAPQVASTAPLPPALWFVVTMLTFGVLGMIVLSAR